VGSFAAFPISYPGLFFPIQSLWAVPDCSPLVRGKEEVLLVSPPLFKSPYGRSPFNPLRRRIVQKLRVILFLFVCFFLIFSAGSVPRIMWSFSRFPFFFYREESHPQYPFFQTPPPFGFSPCSSLGAVGSDPFLSSPPFCCLWVSLCFSFFLSPLHTTCSCWWRPLFLLSPHRVSVKKTSFTTPCSFHLLPGIVYFYITSVATHSRIGFFFLSFTDSSFLPCNVLCLGKRQRGCREPIFPPLASPRTLSSFLRDTRP